MTGEGSIAVAVIVPAIVVVALLVDRANSRRDRERIERWLQRKGLTPLSVKRSWFGGGRDERVYTVAFSVPGGARHETTCKVMSGDQPLFWSEEMFHHLPTPGGEPGPERHRGHPPHST
jgi:hypothetical protein